MPLPEGRKPISDDWYKKMIESYRSDIIMMQESRDFPDNTCPASRHAQMIAESLFQTGEYAMLHDEPEHCAGSIASTVSSLYQARTFLKSLGYDWRVLDKGTVEWYIKQDNTDSDWHEDHDDELMSNPGDKDYET
jgi:hypothetical protein